MNPLSNTRAESHLSAGVAQGVASPVVRSIPPLPKLPPDTDTRSFMEPRIGHDFGRVRVHAGQAGGLPAGRHEREDNRAAGQAPRTPRPSQAPSSVRPMVQRFPDDGPATPARAGSPAEGGALGDLPVPGLIAEDAAGEPGSGRIRKGDFLARLHASVRAAVDAALAGTGRSSQDCPYIDYWFAYYGARDGRHVERAINRFAPETRGAAAPGEYVYLVTERVRRAVETWSKTGRITGLPEEMFAGIPGIAPVTDVETPAWPAAQVALKARDGGVREGGDPREIQARLGAGRALDGGARSRMESAFGADFSRVRVHADAGAAALSARLDARAFTVGSDVAFARGEYRPGTPVGDALLAHELAHVVQQGGARQDGGTAQPAGNDLLEDDANRSAVGAVVSLWGGAKSLMAGIAQSVGPQLRTGLSLRRCGGSAQKQPSRTFLTGPREESYGVLLTEAAQDLERVDFGRAEKTKRAHSEYWDVVEPLPDVRGGVLVRDEYKYKLVLKKDKKLSEALDGLVRDALEAKSQDVWLTASLDCAQFVQAMHLISVRQRLGSDLFDREVEELQKKMGQFEITADYSGLHYLSLVTPTKRYSRESGGSAPYKEYTWKDGRWEGGKEAPPDKTEEQLLKDAPIGSRVTWKNGAAEPGSSFQIENSIKVADDRYAAHGLRDPEGTTETGKNIYTRLELGKALAPDKDAVREAFGETVDADKWIVDYINKYIFVTEIEHYKFPEPKAGQIK